MAPLFLSFIGPGLQPSLAKPGLNNCIHRGAFPLPIMSSWCGFGPARSLRSSEKSASGEYHRYLQIRVHQVSFVLSFSWTSSNAPKINMSVLEALTLIKSICCTYFKAVFCIEIQQCPKLWSKNTVCQQILSLVTHHYSTWHFFCFINEAETQCSDTYM